MPCYDLHTHSTASDGTLTPAESVAQAAMAGVTHLALSDHDTVAGVAEARQAAQDHGIHFIPAAEFSASWRSEGRKPLAVHIVGLQLNTDSPALHRVLRELTEQRLQRAEQIARRLEKAGAPNTLESVHQLAGKGQLTRTHFAQALVSLGHARDVKQAFRRFLGHGKPASVPDNWPGMTDTIACIHAAGGVAVLAHPTRYKLTRRWLLQLIDDFQQAGGDALEVVTGNTTPTEVNMLAGWARRFALAASVGSDYHGAITPWLKPGRLMPLPVDLTPVWALWRNTTT